MDHNKPSTTKRRNKNDYYTKPDPEDDGVEQWIEPEGLVNNASPIQSSKASYKYSTMKKDVLINNHSFRREVQSDPHTLHREQMQHAFASNTPTGYLLPEAPKLVGKGQGLGYEDGNYLGLHPIDRPYVANIDDIKGRPILPLEIGQNTPKTSHPYSCSGVVKLFGPRRSGQDAKELTSLNDARPITVGLGEAPARGTPTKSKKRHHKQEGFVDSKSSQVSVAGQQGTSAAKQKNPVKNSEGAHQMAPTVVGGKNGKVLFTEKNRVAFPSPSRAAAYGPVIAPKSSITPAKTKFLSEGATPQQVGAYQPANPSMAAGKKKSLDGETQGSRVAPVSERMTSGVVSVKNKSRVEHDIGPMRQASYYGHDTRSEHITRSHNDGGEVDPITEYRYEEESVGADRRSRFVSRY